MKSFLFEWWISRRYLKPKNKERFFSLITILSFIGISSGVSILIIVMSVMNGLRSELFDKLIGINGHILIYSKSEKGIENSDEIKKNLEDIKEIENFFPMLESQVLVMGTTQSSGALLRGISRDSLNSLNIISDNIITGSIENINRGEAVIGYRLASKLGLSTGDNLTLLSPRGVSSPFGTIPRSTSFDIKAVFEIGLTDYDGGIVFLKTFDIETFANVHHLVSTIHAEIDSESNIYNLIRDAFPGGSITGAPKLRAMQIIHELEPNNRSIYCGSIGYISFDEKTDLNILIRSMLSIDNKLYFWGGGGIVKKSWALISATGPGSRREDGASIVSLAAPATLLAYGASCAVSFARVRCLSLIHI